LKEKITKEFLIGALLLLVGSLVSLKALPTSFGKGDALVLIATIFWAIENTISKYALRELPGRIIAWGRMFFGSIFILVFLASIKQLSLIGNLNFSQISWVFITSLILLGYLMTWYSGLKHLPVSLATAILMLGSPVTTLLTFINIGIISVKEILSGALIIGGLFFLTGLSQRFIRTVFLNSRGLFLRKL